jgi:hypothetical protein
MEAMRLLVCVAILCAGCGAQTTADDETYHIVDESGDSRFEGDVTVNLATNTLVVSPTEGEEAGSEVVVDYEKSLTAVYERRNRRCYLVGGVPKKVRDPKVIKEALDSQAENALSSEPMTVRVADDYPVKDRSLLPARLRRRCAGRPLNWMEPTTEDTQDETAVEAASDDEQPSTSLQAAKRQVNGANCSNSSCKKGCKWSCLRFDAVILKWVSCKQKCL